MNRAVFIERDGVLNRALLRGNHQVCPATLAEFQVADETEPQLARLKAAGFVLIVVTNQPGIAQGVLSRGELDRMHAQLRRKLPVDDIFVCPHDESDGCPCRKPRSGLFKEARCKWRVDMNGSFVISDKWQDAEAARAAGCTSLLIRSPWNGSVHHDFVLPDLSCVVDKILQLNAATAAGAVRI